MKVALELQPCLKNKSGIGIYTYELAKRLQGYEDLELIGNSFNFMGRNDLTKDLEGLEFKKLYCKAFPYGIYRRIWNEIPIRYTQLFKEKVEITHFFNFIIPPRIEGKVINTIHDLTFLFYPETMDQCNLKRIRQDIDYSIQRSDIITTVSECSRQDIIKNLKVAPDKVKVIYPGVDYKSYSKLQSKEEQQVVREAYELPEQYILYMGTLEPRKNVISLIEAFAKLRKQNELNDIKLVLAGKKGWLYDELFNRVKQLDLEKEVVFTGYVEESHKALIYQMAKCFVFPSIYEGFGIPVLEAMASSVPVVTANVSSLPEVVGQAAILVSPTDIEEMAKSIYRLLVDKAYAEEFKVRGHQQAQKFSWEASAKKLHELYTSLK